MTNYANRQHGALMIKSEIPKNYSVLYRKGE